MNFFGFWGNLLDTVSGCPYDGVVKYITLLLLLALPINAQVNPAQAAIEINSIFERSEIRMVAPTGSMKPTIDENCYILIEKRPWSKLKVGDIIIFKRSIAFSFEGKDYWTTCHRVHSMKPDGTSCLTKGDANDSIDLQLITEKEYLGTVIGILRRD